MIGARLLGWRQQKVAGVVIGALCVIGATELRIGLEFAIPRPDMTFLFFVAAVLLAAVVGGATSGLTTTILSLAAGIGLIIGPHEFATSKYEWIRVAVFALEGLAISVAAEQLQLRTVTLRATAHERESAHRKVERMALLCRDDRARQSPCFRARSGTLTRPVIARREAPDGGGRRHRWPEARQ